MTMAREPKKASAVHTVEFYEYEAEELALTLGLILSPAVYNGGVTYDLSLDGTKLTIRLEKHQVLASEKPAGYSSPEFPVEKMKRPTDDTVIDGVVHDGTPNA